MHILFSSIHCYLDPSSGAALCTRELLERLAGRGMDCRVLTTGILDPEPKRCHEPNTTFFRQCARNRFLTPYLLRAALGTVSATGVPCPVLSHRLNCFDR